MFNVVCLLCLVGVPTDHGTNWAVRLSQTLSDFRRESLYCDLWLYGGDSTDVQTIFHAHACVMCAAMPALFRCITAKPPTRIYEACISMPTTEVEAMWPRCYAPTPTESDLLFELPALTSTPVLDTPDEPSQSFANAFPLAPSVSKVKESEIMPPHQDINASEPTTLATLQPMLPLIPNQMPETSLETVQHHSVCVPERNEHAVVTDDFQRIKQTAQATLATLQPVMPPVRNQIPETPMEVVKQNLITVPKQNQGTSLKSRFQPKQQDALLTASLMHQNIINNNGKSVTTNTMTKTTDVTPYTVGDPVPKVACSAVQPVHQIVSPPLPSMPAALNTIIWNQQFDRGLENRAMDLTTKISTTEASLKTVLSENIGLKPVEVPAKKSKRETAGGSGSKAIVEALGAGLPVPGNLPAPYPGILQPVYTGSGQIQMVQLVPLQYANLMCWPQQMAMKPETVPDTSRKPVLKTAKKSPVANSVKKEEPREPTFSSPIATQLTNATSPINLAKAPYLGNVDTKDVAERVIRDLKKYCIPQAVFAQVVLGRTQGTLSDLLRKPKPWSKLKSGRETFSRMYHWLQIPEQTRILGLKNAADALDAGQLRHKRKSSAEAFDSTQQTKEEPDETCLTSSQPKKSRNVFTPLQRDTLTAIFKETKRPTKLMQKMIAEQLGLKLSTVANFFMNARRRSPEMYTEETDSENAQNTDKKRGSAEFDKVKLETINQHLTAYTPKEAFN